MSWRALFYITIIYIYCDNYYILAQEDLTVGRQVPYCNLLNLTDEKPEPREGQEQGWGRSSLDELGFGLQNHKKTGVVENAYSPSSGEVKAGGLKFKFILSYTEFKASLGYIRTCLPSHPPPKEGKRKCQERWKEPEDGEKNSVRVGSIASGTMTAHHVLNPLPQE